MSSFYIHSRTLSTKSFRLLLIQYNRKQEDGKFNLRKLSLVFWQQN